MNDPTEAARRAEVQEINSNPKERGQLEAKHGQVWDTDELRRDFEVQGFAAPYVVVERKHDHVVGSLRFQHHPRFYFSFEPAPAP